ncbi:flavin-containing monooxygenase [Promicromonospora sp. Populi]|uniref:flavin-containing monooxygenase n=1 Tax=Promicromonospora sp. Populi TaxID=3239420 RepID=UPI0034E23002
MTAAHQDPHGAAHVDVAVVGAGLAGVGLGARLRRAGRTDFAILERADDVGGTWRDNVYPGVACDIPSALYSYSFLPQPAWSRVFAPGAEIHRYVQDVARAEGVDQHLRLGTSLTGARWDDDEATWHLSTSRGPLSARVLVTAVGRLSEPRVPEIPGLGTFPGRVFHSARWDQDLPAGLRVGVVGTGASAVQLVPELARRAASVVVLQRTPPWVLPRGDRAYAPGEARPGRDELAEEADRLFEARLAGTTAEAALRERAEAHLRAQVPDPELRALLTPDYAVGCKRALFSDDWYPALQQPGVTLEPSAPVAVEGSALVAASGARYEVDVLVLATGFETTRPPFAELVTGRGAQTLAEHWADGMTSHASTVVHGFPNLFVLDGPNAGLGHHSALEVIEAQIGYVLGALDHLDANDAPLEVSAAAEAAYTREIDQRAAGTVWLRGGCRSWYVDERSGRLTLLWPGRAAEYRERFAVFDPTPFPRPVGTPSR